jgi:hypothetical protein
MAKASKHRSMHGFDLAAMATVLVLGCSSHTHAAHPSPLERRPHQPQAEDSDAWGHAWDTPGDAMWGYAGMVGQLMTSSQLQFVAKTYKVRKANSCLGGNEMKPKRACTSATFTHCLYH